MVARHASSKALFSPVPEFRVARSPDNTLSIETRPSTVDAFSHRDKRAEARRTFETRSPSWIQFLARTWKWKRDGTIDIPSPATFFETGRGTLARWTSSAEKVVDFLIDDQSDSWEEVPIRNIRAFPTRNSAYLVVSTRFIAVNASFSFLSLDLLVDSLRN